MWREEMFSFRSMLTFRLWRNLLSSMCTHILSPPTFCPLFFLSLRILLTHTLRNFMDILDRVALLFEMLSNIISTCRIWRPCENLNTNPYITLKSIRIKKSNVQNVMDVKVLEITDNINIPVYILHPTKKTCMGTGKKGFGPNAFSVSSTWLLALPANEKYSSYKTFLSTLVFSPQQFFLVVVV